MLISSGLYLWHFHTCSPGRLINCICVSQTTPHTVHTPPAVGPTGPCPPYATPEQPGPVRLLHQWSALQSIQLSNWILYIKNLFLSFCRPIIRATTQTWYVLLTLQVVNDWRCLYARPGLCVHVESWSPTSPRRGRWPRTMDWPATCCSQCPCALCPFA